jgi:DNA-binding winged helix-turn-helix (wHTH) protein
LKNGQPLALPPKVLVTLTVLVESSGHIVNKEELMKRVWPDSFVEENNLNKNISALRKLLGDGGEDSEYIDTVPKRGYRFIGPVKRVQSEPAASPLMA